MDQVDVPALTKGLSLCTGILAIICSIVFMAEVQTYLSVVVGLETAVFASIMLIIEVQAPEPAIEKLRQFAPMMLSIPGQLFLSILMALFLFAMGAFGIAMGVIVMVVVGINGYTMMHYPDAMPARFGQPEQGQYSAQPPYAAAPFQDDPPPTYNYNPTPQQQQPPPQPPSTADL